MNSGDRRESLRVPAHNISGVIIDDKGTYYPVNFKNISENGMKFLNHNLPPSGVAYVWNNDIDLISDVYVAKLYEDIEGTVYVITTTNVRELADYHRIYNIALAKEWFRKINRETN